MIKYTPTKKVAKYLEKIGYSGLARLISSKKVKQKAIPKELIQKAKENAQKYKTAQMRIAS